MDEDDALPASETAPFGPYLSPASFRVPTVFARSGWHEHAPFAFWLVAAQRPATIVELGAHHGFSYLTFCEAVQAAGLDTRCWAVDTWKGDEHAGFYSDGVFRKLSAYHDPRFGEFSTLVRSTFDDAVTAFADGSIDLLHIDGRHRYEDVAHDFATWQAKVSDRAIVLFHDTDEFQRDFGVHRLWEEVSAGRPHFRFTHGHGLGVLGVGSDIAPGPAALFSASGSTADAVRAAYQRLGGAIADRCAALLAAHAPQSGGSAQAEVNRLRQELATNRREADNLRRIVAASVLGGGKR